MTTPCRIGTTGGLRTNPAGTMMVSTYFVSWMIRASKLECAFCESPLDELQARLTLEDGFTPGCSEQLPGPEALLFLSVSARLGRTQAKSGLKLGRVLKLVHLPNGPNFT